MWDTSDYEPLCPLAILAFYDHGVFDFPDIVSKFLWLETCSTPDAYLEAMEMFAVLPLAYYWAAANFVLFFGLSVYCLLHLCLLLPSCSLLSIKYLSSHFWAGVGAICKKSQVPSSWCRECVWDVVVSVLAKWDSNVGCLISRGLILGCIICLAW